MTKLANPFSTITEHDLTEVVRRLVSELSPQAIYLFGSHVTGVPDADSDVDLMVLVDDGSPTHDYHRRGYACLHGTGWPIELHVSSRARFERFADVFGSLQHEIRRKGVLLYASKA
jgi:predicted nucleotidyltransferase